MTRELTHEHDTDAAHAAEHATGEEAHVVHERRTVLAHDEGRTRDVAVHRASAGAVAARIALAVIGAGLLFVGALLDWLGGITGTELGYRAYYRTSLSGGATFLTSAGAIVMALAVIALLGLVTRSGWPTRLAGALALAAFALFVVQAVRGDAVNTFTDLRLGIWLVLIGAIAAVVGGFVGPERTVIEGGGGTA